MQKNKLRLMFIVFSIIILISTLSFATETAPDTNTAEDQSEIPIEELLTEQGQESPEATNSNWINNDLYEFGDKIEINQVVDGNAFIIAKEVVISSEIGGDVFIMANKITIDGGYIYSNLFAMAEEISINGIVYDAYILANNFTLGDNGYVYRDLKVSGNNVNINGKIRRDAYISSPNCTLNSENVPLIGGNLNYTAEKEMNIPENAIQGEVNYSQETIKEESVAQKVLGYVMNAINNLVYAFVVILLAILLAPKFVERVSNMSSKKAFASLGIGILVPIIAIIALFILLISTVASSVALALTFVFIAICMSGSAFASIYFGSIISKLLKWEGKVTFVVSCLIAALAIWALSKIPFIGGAIGFFAAVFGIGTLIVNVLYKKEKVVEEASEKTEE